MSVMLPGSTSPGVGFELPFEMLGACHERVLRSIALMRRLAGHLAGHGSDAMAADAARDVMRYFDLAAPAHHRDEELHVLPRLRGSGDASLVALAQRLASDHLEIERQWLGLRPVLVCVSQQEPVDTRDLNERVTAFELVHEGHIAAEDRIAFPAARHAALGEGPDALPDMGREMALRRGVKLG